MIRLPFRITKKIFFLWFLLWTLWAAFFGIILSIAANINYFYAFMSSLISYYPMAVLSILVLLFCRSFKVENHNSIWFIIVHFLTANFFSATWLTTNYLIMWVLFGDDVFTWMPIPEVASFQYFGGVQAYAFLAGIFYTMEFFKRYREKELKASQLQTLTREAELKALKSQINPHFLFNTLNSIFALIDSNTEKAKNTVTMLSSLLRYALAGFNKKFVPLEVEIDNVQTYLAIEQERFGKRLKVFYDIDPALMQKNVPPMFLQPLVENAVKHGISQTKEGGTITISAKMINGYIEFNIMNTGKSKTNAKENQPESNGIGLKNIQQRLERIYEDDFVFNTSYIEPHGFSVNLRFKNK